jgi:hypothetical protein
VSRLSPLAEAVLESHRFDAISYGSSSALLLADFPDATEAQLESVLGELATNGFAVPDDSDELGEPGGTYYPTPAGVVERERRLRARGVRHPVFRDLGRYNLEDVVLAIAVGHREQQRQISAPVFLGPGDVRLDRLKVLLFDIAETALHAAIETLVKARFVEPVLGDYGGHETTDGVRSTPFGEHHFRRVVRGRLGITEAETILDEHHLEEILCFYVWQSDDGRSRREIERALASVIDELSQVHSPVSPLRIELASRPGDGATRIDGKLFLRIDASRLISGRTEGVLEPHRPWGHVTARALPGRCRTRSVPCLAYGAPSPIGRDRSALGRDDTQAPLVPVSARRALIKAEIEQLTGWSRGQIDTGLDRYDLRAFGSESFWATNAYTDRAIARFLALDERSLSTLEQTIDLRHALQDKLRGALMRGPIDWAAIDAFPWPEEMGEDRAR